MLGAGVESVELRAKQAPDCGMICFADGLWQKEVENKAHAFVHEVTHISYTKLP